MFFLYMYQATGIPLGGLFLAYENYGSDGYYGVSADDQSNALVVGQSVYFVTLVVLQWQAALLSESATVADISLGSIF